MLRKTLVVAVLVCASFAVHAENQAALAMYNQAISPRIDSFGNALPSDAEQCRRSLAAGGVLTERCMNIRLAARYAGKPDPTQSSSEQTREGAQAVGKTKPAHPPATPHNTVATYQVDAKERITLTDVMCTDPKIADNFGNGVAYMALDRSGSLETVACYVFEALENSPKDMNGKPMPQIMIEWQGKPDSPMSLLDSEFTFTPQGRTLAQIERKRIAVINQAEDARLKALAALGYDGK